MVALAKALRRKRPKGAPMSLREISAALAAEGHLNGAGKPFNPKSVSSMLTGHQERAMKLAFCAACGSTEDLQHYCLVARSGAGSDDERNLITLCGSCRARLDERQANSARGAATRAERARAFAERLRPVLAPLADLSANAAAQELRRRGVATARGGCWSAGAVIAVRKRLEGGGMNLEPKAPGATVT